MRVRVLVSGSVCCYSVSWALWDRCGRIGIRWKGGRAPSRRSASDVLVQVIPYGAVEEWGSS